jgi:hypothetical protein
MDYFWALLETSSFAFFSYSFYRWQQRHTKILDLIEFVQKANLMKPSELKRAMDYDGPADMLKNIREFDEGRNYSKGLVFVQGLVESSFVIRSFLNHTTKLIMSSVSSESIFSNNKSFEEVEGKLDLKYVSEFNLGETLTDHKLTLNNNRTIDFSNALHLIHSVVHMRSLSPLERFLSWVLFCIKLFLSMSNVGKKLSGFKVGSKRVERGIMLGQYLVAFGEVIFDRQNKELRMNNPLFFLKDKAQMLQMLQDKSSRQSKNMTMIFSISAILGVFVIRRLLKNVGNLLQTYRKLYMNTDMRGFFQLRRLFINDFRCMDCRNSVRNVIYKPCLHLAVCSRCYELNGEKICQQCKVPIEGCVPIFNV